MNKLTMYSVVVLGVVGFFCLYEANLGAKGIRHLVEQFSNATIIEYKPEALQDTTWNAMKYKPEVVLISLQGMAGMITLFIRLGYTC